MSLENITVKERRSAAPTDNPERSGARSVFIVDDEAMVGEVVSMVLSIEGFKTRLFTSPTDALEVFEASPEKPDLLITDYAMHPLTGVELIERCRAILPNLRSILYSGNISAENMAEFRGIPDTCLSKPFLPKELIRTVQSLLAQAR